MHSKNCYRIDQGSRNSTKNSLDQISWTSWIKKAEICIRYELHRVIIKRKGGKRIRTNETLAKLFKMVKSMQHEY